jgi:hypothetical protein
LLQAKKTVGQYVEYISKYVEGVLQQMNNEAAMQQQGGWLGALNLHEHGFLTVCWCFAKQPLHAAAKACARAALPMGSDG